MLKEEIKQLAREIWHDVVKIRRHLHRYPELSFSEYETSAYIKSILDEWGIAWTAMADTGIVAIVEGEQHSDRVIALRADMDALPIQEANDLDYVSLHPGVMHACGHDAHTASLLGSLRILQSLKNKFGGTIKFIFQPGEEKIPGGASQMIQEGVLDHPKPQIVLGQHVLPSLEVGKIGIRPGKYMASVDEIYVKVRGKGGHGAQPHQNIDPVLISAHLIIALQQIVSRNANPAHPTVLSFGKVIANGATNIIPDEVAMEGTFRTMDETWRSEAHQKMKKMAESLAESMGGTCDFTILKGYPVLINDPEVSAQVSRHATTYLGPDQVEDLNIWMAAEDFAYYSHHAASCFYMLGVHNKTKGIESSLHTPTFKLDEDALQLSTGLMAYLAIMINQ